MRDTRPFDVWLEQSSLVPQTQRDYYRALEGRISDWAREAGVLECNVLDIPNAEVFGRVRPRIEALPVFRERNAKEKYRFSAALRRFGDYLGGVGVPSAESDEEENGVGAESPRTSDMALRSARIGQGEFRCRLLERWGCCALLGVRDRFLLVASHIKPWAKSTDTERLDPNNGLLLTAHVDQAFDAGCITFDERGGRLISPRFRDAEMLGLRKGMGIRPDREHLPYLRYHRKSVFASM